MPNLPSFPLVYISGLRKKTRPIQRSNPEEIIILVSNPFLEIPTTLAYLGAGLSGERLNFDEFAKSLSIMNAEIIVSSGSSGVLKE